MKQARSRVKNHGRSTAKKGRQPPLASVSTIEPMPSLRVRDDEVVFVCQPESREDPSYVSRPALERELLALVEPQWDQDRRASLLLVGPPGGGKTTLIRWLARALGFDLYRLTAASDGDPGDVMSVIRITRGGDYQTLLTPLGSAIVRGPSVLLIESIDLMPESTLVHLGAIWDRCVLPIFQAAIGILVDDARLVVAAAANDARALPEWLRSRLFAYPVDLPEAEEGFDLVLGSGAIPDSPALREFIREKWTRYSDGADDRPCFRTIEKLGRLREKFVRAGIPIDNPRLERIVEEIFRLRGDLPCVR